ncbi:MULTISPECIES: hypothetical protein [unclassified Rhodococcus (in: high G+C Gram-positive bacteria)]|uniref:hypothetical protein n=1 Tax=unclassified Rhodococcus (in: high G+C Gram-positive bacteria) TaxID=192944 RepID=UPI0006F5382A|nr:MULTISPECIES: hypothetical protein [unclassified Rhodococcus (in: high G+C Gram-positive bacteria)]KQU28330.1 hypothetical protein ASG69_09900 [Rhodococcus sp. Leaf225]KQU46437.1 hypothetical protein ASH03_06935 [Rhodococcus sp. Leaf258]
MSSAVAFVVGGTLGTVVHYVATSMSRAPQRMVLAANVAASALYGVVAAMGAHYAGGWNTPWAAALLGFAGAAAPFTALGLQASATTGPGRVRTIVLGIGANVLAGAAAALLGYLSLRFGVTLYRKLR